LFQCDPIAHELELSSSYPIPIGSRITVSEEERENPEERVNSLELRHLDLLLQVHQVLDEDLENKHLTDVHDNVE
jgi:hypothetical protein